MSGKYGQYIATQSAGHGAGRKAVDHRVDAPATHLLTRPQQQRIGLRIRRARWHVLLLREAVKNPGKLTPKAYRRLH